MICYFVTRAPKEEMLRRNKKREELPKLQEFLLMSRAGANYHWVCEKLMKCVVGRNTWRKRYYKEVLSDIATVSDESFLLLVIENNFKRWMEEVEHRAKVAVITEDNESEDETWKDTIASALYTNSGKSRANGKGSNRRCGGWSREGCMRFNDLYGRVREDRKSRDAFEQALKERFAQAHSSNNEDSGSEDEGEEIIPANDMKGVRQPSEANASSEESDAEDDEE
jgi:hypothetical protein